MKTKIIFLIGFCLVAFTFNKVHAQIGKNYSNPCLESKKDPNTLKTKKHDKAVTTNRFNAHKKANGNGNSHPYVAKRKKMSSYQPAFNSKKGFKQKMVSRNKKHRNKDKGNKAPRTW